MVFCFTFQVAYDDILCIECFLLLQERISSNTPPSQIEVSLPLGHISVCFGCGISIASRRTHRVSQDCPQRPFILRWTPAYHVSVINLTEMLFLNKSLSQ